MMDEVHVYMCLHIALIKSNAGNKIKLFSSPFLISTSSRLPLTEASRNDHVAAYGTALRSATEENESVGWVTVSCPSKATQCSSTAD